MLVPLLLSTPWVALLAFVVLRVRLPRPLGEGGPTRSPFVTVVVPARNERLNIERCLRSLTESRYPAFEIVVVDDRSEDDTGAIARTIDRGGARSVRVLDGAPVPEGWLGKPWACAQGAAVAEGDVILFTDADTIHGPELLERAVAVFEEDGADVVTVGGRQLMESFWERVVQPQALLNIALRFPRLEEALAEGRWRDAIANGQFLMFTRSTYDALGGHAAVKGEVIEDLALAQLVVREGYRLSARSGEDVLATRMYRSLGHLIEGWSKNLLVGARRTVPPPLRRWIAPVSLLSALILWVIPPLALACAAAGFGGRPLLVWSGTAVGVSLALWAGVTRRMGGPAGYGLLYPLGALVGLFILARSWSRGERVEWKGRRYVLDASASGL